MIMARLLFIFWALSGAQAFGSETEQQRQAALWLSEYQTNWYPSAQIRAQTKQYIDATFTGTNYQSLQFLPAKESKHLLLASLLYLRSTSYLEYTENLTDYAQLAIELAQRQQDPIAQSEGHYFYAYDLLTQRKTPTEILHHLNVSQELLPDESHDEAEKALILALRLYNQAIQARLQFLYGNFHNQVAIMDGLFADYPQIPTQIRMELLYLKGVGHYKMGENDSAFRAFFESLELTEQTQEKRLLPDLDRYIGLTYLQQNNKELAIEYLQKAIELYRERKMLRRGALTLRNMGKIFLTDGDPHQAIAIFLTALQKEREEGSRQRIAQVSLLIATTYIEMGEQQLASPYLDEAKQLLLALDDTPDNSRLLPITLLELKIEASSIADDALANIIHKIEQLEPVIQTSGNKDLQQLWLQTLIQLYQRANEYKKVSELMAKELAELRTQLSSSNGWKIKQIEENYQQKALEKQIEDSQLALENSLQHSAQYRKYATWLFVLLLVFFAAALRQRNKLHQLGKLLRKESYQARHNPATSLANERQMYNSMFEEIKRLQVQQEAWYDSNSPSDAPSGKLFVVIHLPVLHSVHDRYGMEGGRRLERKLGQYLRSKYDENHLFQPQDDVIALILPAQPLPQAAKRLFKTLEGFKPPGFDLRQSISIGMIQFPFVSKASRSTNIFVVGELLLLALAAACRESERHHHHAWVALTSIDAIPVTLFNGQIRNNLLLGIEKGFIKVLSSFDKSTIDWPQQSESQPNSKNSTSSQQIILDQVDG